MFERFTERARRTIFFARYHASQFGTPYIETEHLLLGIMREDRSSFAGTGEALDLHKELESQIPVREKFSTSVDLPLSAESKRALEFAAEEADSLDHRDIDTSPLLLGLMRVENCVPEEKANTAIHAGIEEPRTLGGLIERYTGQSEDLIGQILAHL